MFFGTGSLALDNYLSGMQSYAAAVKQKAAQLLDEAERITMRGLSDDQLQRFQDRVLGIHRRFDAVMARRAVK